MKKRESLLCRVSIVEGLIDQVLKLKKAQNTNNQDALLATELNLTISDLEITKQNLLDDLAKLDFMKQFEKYPWVIKKNPTQPTYYQIISVVGKTVTLSRKGQTKIIAYEAFYRDYVEATEEDVLQHVKYMTDNGIKFLFEPVDCSIESKIIIDFSGGSDVLAHIAKNKAKEAISIPASTLNPITVPVQKSADADFYMVTLKQGYGSKVYHPSYEIAEAEAIRLSKQENKKAYVLGVVGEIEVIPTTTYETKIKNY